MIHFSINIFVTVSGRLLSYNIKLRFDENSLHIIPYNNIHVTLVTSTTVYIFYKGRQPRRGYQLRSPSPFPTTITVSLRTPPNKLLRIHVTLITCLLFIAIETTADIGSRGIDRNCVQHRFYVPVSQHFGKKKTKKKKQFTCKRSMDTTLPCPFLPQVRRTHEHKEERE